MKRIMIFTSKDCKCGDFKVTKEKGQGYAENNECWLRTDYISREQFQTELDKMCSICRIKISEHNKQFPPPWGGNCLLCEGVKRTWI